MSTIFDLANSISKIRTINKKIEKIDMNDLNNINAIQHLLDDILSYASTLKEISVDIIRDIRENGPSIILKDGSHILCLLRDDMVKYYLLRSDLDTIKITQPPRCTTISTPIQETHYISGFGVWISEDESNIIMKKLAVL
jgi:hypothetical protein